tara:strand:- start:560 stop:715 length:156 start_codon:yes stop_codon:yes gene_type:complete
MISAVISIGSNIPVDALALYTKAISITTDIPIPLRPAFDMPRIHAADNAIR